MFVNKTEILYNISSKYNLGKGTLAYHFQMSLCLYVCLKFLGQHVRH